MLNNAEISESRPRSAPADTALVDTVARRVLIVEGEPPRMRAFIDRIHAPPHNVIYCTDREHARQLVRSDEFDIALIEIEEFDESARTLLRTMRHDHPTTRIVMMSQLPNDEIWVHCMNDGATDVVATPLTADELLRLL